jgi:hypothetical protein
MHRAKRSEFLQLPLWPAMTRRSTATIAATATVQLAGDPETRSDIFTAPMGDGNELIVVEHWAHLLPDDLRQQAGAVIAELCGESRAPVAIGRSSIRLPAEGQCNCSRAGTALRNADSSARRARSVSRKPIGND